MLMKMLAYAVAVTLLAAVASGQESYSAATEMCCNGKVHDKKRGLRCCGEETFQSMDSICCGNTQVVDFPNDVDEYFACCLNAEEDAYEAYDLLTERCCDGTVVSVDTSDRGVYQVCCGTELIDSVKETCCGGVVFNKTIGMECCGDTLVEMERGGSAQCCGDEVISTDTHICCTTYDYNQEQHKRLDTSVAQLKRTDDDMCCGNEQFNVNTELCCAKYRSGKVDFYTLDKPEDLGEKEHAYCCGEEVISVKRDGTSPKRSCCYGGAENDDISYDITTERCCGGLVKQIDDDDSAIYCCYQTGEFYDLQTDRCTATGLVSKSDVTDDADALKDVCKPGGISHTGIRYHQTY